MMENDGLAQAPADQSLVGDAVVFDVEVSKVSAPFSGPVRLIASPDGLIIEGRSALTWMRAVAVLILLGGFVLGYVARGPLFVLLGAALAFVLGALLRLPGSSQRRQEFTWKNVRNPRIRLLGPVAALVRPEPADATSIRIEVKRGGAWRYLHVVPDEQSLGRFVEAVQRRSEQAVKFEDLRADAAPPGSEDTVVADRWVRFLARTIDMWLISMALIFSWGIAIAIFGGGVPDTERKGIYYVLYLNMLVLLPALLVEAVLYRFLGWTPGKAVFGVRVLNSAGERLSPTEYLKRNIKIWVFGYGLGIPIVSLITMAWQFDRLGDGKPATYDEHDARTVRSGRRVGFQIAGAVVFFVGMILLTNWVGGSGTGDSEQRATADRQRSAFLQQVAREAEAMNRQLPSMVSDQVRAESVRLVDSAIHYRYTMVQVPPLEFDGNAFEQQVMPQVRQLTCDRETRIYLEQGLTYTYAYHDMNGQELAVVVVDLEDCL